MEEVNYKQIGEEYGLGEAEAKELYDQWIETVDVMDMTYPSENFRAYVSRYLTKYETEEYPSVSDRIVTFDSSYVVSAPICSTTESVCNPPSTAGHYVTVEESSNWNKKGKEKESAIDSQFSGLDLLKETCRKDKEACKQLEIDESDLDSTLARDTTFLSSSGADSAIAGLLEDPKPGKRASFTLKEGSCGIDILNLSNMESKNKTRIGSLLSTPVKFTSLIRESAAQEGATPTLSRVRGIDEILASEDTTDFIDSTGVEDDEFLQSFVSLSVNNKRDDDDKKHLASVQAYAAELGHINKIKSSEGVYQKAAAGVMLRVAERVARSNIGNKQAFFLIIPSEAVAKHNILSLADKSKRNTFVRAHMLQQAGTAETKTIWDRPWKSFANTSTEYKFPSEQDYSLVRMRDKSVFKLDGTEAVYKMADVKKNIKVVYLSQSETRRLV